MSDTDTIPQAPEAEVAVLGSMVLDQDGVAIGDVMAILAAGDFCHQKHQAVYDAIVGVYDSGQTLDLVLLKQWMADAGTLDGVGGTDYLVDIASSVPSAASAEYYARIVRDKAVKRRLIDVLHTGLRDCREGSGHEPAAELVNRIEAAVFAVARDDQRGEVVMIGAAMQDSYDSQSERDGSSIMGVETGFLDLDHILSGMQRQNMIVLAARPSVGKTALALNIAANVAGKGMPVLVFSMEMTRQEIGSRVMCSLADVDSHRMRSNLLNADDYGRLQRACGRAADAPLHIDDRSGLTLTQLRARARRMKASHGIGLVVVDYLQLMTVGGRKANRQEEVADLSRGMKALAGELDVPILCLCQLNRQSESREGHRPRLSDLRESGAIEQDADVVILLHREDCHHRGDAKYEYTNTAEVIVAKQRNGPAGVIKLQFDDATATFRNQAGSGVRG